MAIDNLLGTVVKIRRGWHGGRVGKVVVFKRHANASTSYTEIKVQLKGSGEIVSIYGDDELVTINDGSL